MRSSQIFGGACSPCQAAAGRAANPGAANAVKVRVSRVVDELAWAGRYLRRRPGFAVAVSLTLAAGIAVATTAFGVARAVLWRPLPFSDPGRLVFVWEEVERDGQRHAARVTGARYAAWRDSGSGFRSLALFGATGFTIEHPAGTSTVRGIRVSTNYFDVLGIEPALGRTFASDDGVPGNERVVILSDAFWRDRLGGRREAVGEFLRLGGESYRILGVMPPVVFPAWPVNPATATLDADSRQLWVPIARTAAVEQGARAHVFGVVGRLEAGVSAIQASERLSATASPDTPDPHAARVQPFRDQFVFEARAPLLALLGASLVVLLIACANLATLYASAFEARHTDLAVRAAVGAGVLRLVRQLAVEAVLLAAAGSIGGLALARVALTAVPSSLPSSIPLLTAPRLDPSAAFFGLALGLLASLIFTAWPITRLLTHAPMPRGVVVGSRGLVYRTLVVAQVALTMGLVPAAGLLAQSLRTVERQDAGFRITDTVIAEVGLATPRNAAPQAIARAEQDVLAALAARPNVRAVAAAYDHPLEANWSENPQVVGDGGAVESQRQAELRIVSPGYVEAVGVVIVEGRAFTERDRFDGPGVALVNEAFARELGGRVIGRRLRSGTPRAMYGASAPGEFEIVGVVGNERFRGLEHPAQPAFYLSTRQFPQASFTLIVRAADSALTVVPDLRATLHAVDPRITFDRALPLDAILGVQLLPRRVTTHVIAGFAATALALAALGLYGLLSLLVASRRHEIGVRLAIGASPTSVARRIIAESLRTTSFGVILGVGLSFPATRVVEHLLVGVSRNDASTLALSVSLLLLIAATGALFPAIRAAHIDPATVLRAER